MDVLVLGPGGIKGYQELGVLYYLEESNKLNQLHTLIGVSVGAMISLLYNVGLSVKEILYLSLEKSNFVNINDLDILNIINNIKRHSGIFSNDTIRDSLNDTIINKLGFIPSLQELYEMTNKELIVVTYNLTRESVIYMSYKNYPNISCVEAVLLSINIPVIFHMLRMNDEIHIDGAFGDPYPILLKDNGRNRIMGVYIETRCGARDNTLLYIHDVMHCLFTNLTMRNIQSCSSMCKNLALKCEIMYVIGTDVSIADKVRMFLYGYSEAKSFNYCY